MISITGWILFLDKKWTVIRITASVLYKNNPSSSASHNRWFSRSLFFLFHPGSCLIPDITEKTRVGIRYRASSIDKEK
ncbi:MAG: hypothetical protein JXB88_05510 [Spirochaetales bacterium]|nr:hypothetical protein [Spirochaetales bacterium]